MPDISRIDLFDKLDPLLYRSLEGAASFCKLRGNPYVELAHWLHQIVHERDSDLHRIARRFGIDDARLEADLLRALDRLPRGASSVSDLSAHIDEAVERAWVCATLRYGAWTMRGAHLLLGLLGTPGLRNVLLGISAEFGRIAPQELAEGLADIVAGSPEGAQTAAATPRMAADGPGASAGASDTAGPVGTPAGGQGQAVLQRYAIDLTARARAGEIDPVCGRDAEIRRLVDILMRRRQNNPLLAGEAGVGKTAVMEGLALRVAAGDVPPPLRGVSLWLLDLGLLQAGAGVKGEFETRLRSVIDAVQGSAQPVILCIDEIHTLVGAGGAAGTGDAANLLKPALARGQLRTIGATTWSEYKRFIEPDPALTRRFQVVQVDEPDTQTATDMLRAVAGRLQAHHGVLLLDEAVDAAVRLSQRYVPARQLPDKAVALLDTACARVAVSQHAVPPAVEDARRATQALDLERAIAVREAGLGVGEPQRLRALDERRGAVTQRLHDCEAQWESERAIAAEIFGLRERLAGAARSADQPEPSATLLEELRQASARLAQAQEADRAMVFPAVDAQAVAAVVADWTGIPVGRMLRDEAQAVLDLADTLGRRVIGQRDGLDAIARRVQTARARLDDPDKPVGVFLLCGPSGVGKTETALALAETLYGGEQNLVTINMSEFQEPHTVSTLKGAPPGYVGYGQGGVLTEAVRRRPYSVVLLDEVEKAHPDVHELFFQVFDKGWMEDGEGRRIDFRNTLIILTSNVGSTLIADLCRDPQRTPEAAVLAGALREPLLQVFPAALLGRLVVVPYAPLSDGMLAGIVDLQLDRIGRRVSDHHGIALECTDEARQLIVSRCTEVESGARNVAAILTHAVLPRISRALLAASLQSQQPERMVLGVNDGEFELACS